MSDPDVCVEKSEPNSLQICQVFRLKTSERSVRSYYVLRDRHDGDVRYSDWSSLMNQPIRGLNVVTDSTRLTERNCSMLLV